MSAVKISIGEVSPGQYLLIKDKPCQVLTRTHTKLGRGQASLSLKLRNLSTGDILYETFKGNRELLQIELARETAQFLYQDKNKLHFLADKSLEDHEIPEERVGGGLKFLKTEQKVALLLYQGRPLRVELPPKVDLKVVSAEPAVRGDTAKGKVTKSVMLETNASILVPLFIKEGDIIRVNTETGEYVERAR